MQLQVQRMAYDTSEVYLIFKAKNKPGINFETDRLNVYKTKDKKRITLYKD